MVPEKINVNTLIIAKILHLIRAIQEDLILPCWCTGISLNLVYFGALIPHEKGVSLDTKPGHDGRLY